MCSTSKKSDPTERRDQLGDPGAVAAVSQQEEDPARGRPVVFRVIASSWATGSPPKRLAEASASSGLGKQNTTKSLSSRRRAYVSCAADKAFAAVNITSLFLRPRALSAASAT
jgi:hypothetical protein